MPTFVADEIVTAAKLNAATARDWTTWSPTLTGITQGNGTVTARYVQIGKTVIATFRFVFGSSGSAITASPTISTPVTASSSYDNEHNWVGGVHILDEGTADFHGMVRLHTPTTFSCRLYGAAGAIVNGASITSTVPMTWATGDKLTFTATYEAA